MVMTVEEEGLVEGKDCKLQTQDARDYSHPTRHWVSGARKCWRWDASQLFLHYCATGLDPIRQMAYYSADNKCMVPVGCT
eukprot:6291769-Ditylum_brightwellii.AAC.2